MTSPAFSRCFDPSGARYGIPTYPWKLAPEGMATRRQLRARGLRPGGQPVAAQVMYRSRRRKSGAAVAYLYRVELAQPVRPMTARKWGALALAMLARRTCPQCRRDAGYVIPTSLGTCVTCAYPDTQHAPQSAVDPLGVPA
ncbi:RRQRL motif-containing zinc-binding protein [Streptomyces sp. URMC 123]|uniref:RRQRL motif-containing zinc-binding protein n=1 Tax=Streptomyces sp. URMC 123 TaxID=3423403 RepID=UPI003F1C764C